MSDVTAAAQPTFPVQRPMDRSNRQFVNDNLDVQASGSSQSGLLLYWTPGDTLQPSEALAGWHGAAKRAFDLIAAAGALLFLAPLLFFVALATKLESRGPVFFRQERDGKNNVPFQVLRFRSMRLDECDASGVRQTAAGDPRITKVGASCAGRVSMNCRSSSMSFWATCRTWGHGPTFPKCWRLAPSINSSFDYHDLRLMVHPALTGWT